MTTTSLFLRCAFLALLVLLLNNKALAACSAQKGYTQYHTFLTLSNISAPADTAIGASVDGITHIADNADGPNWNYYMMYCASGTALTYLTVTGPGSIGTANAFETGIAGIGISITYSAPYVAVSGRTSAAIGPCTITKLSGYSCPLRAMTFYFDQGMYEIKVIKTAAQTGVGTIKQIIVDQGSNGNGTTWLGDLKINGTISASGCTISDSNKTLDISMGDFPVTAFSGPGSTTPVVEVPLTLNCPTIGTAVKVTATANGGALDAPNGVLNLTAGSTATGLGVQLLKSDASTALPLNTRISLGASTAAETTFKLYARYRQTSSTVTSGTANAMATFTLNYQ